MTSVRAIPFLAGTITALLTGGAVIAFLFFAATPSDTSLQLPSVIYSAAGSSIAPPSRLRIPALSVDAHVQQVGRTAAGIMASPNNFTDVGWYTGGPRPGEEGSSVIAGHVDNALALDGVFKHLDALSVGSDVYVDTAIGTTLHFRVIRVEVYPYDKVPLDELFTKMGGTYLNLVTCSGAWLSTQHSYDHRLVVYTELVQ